MGIQRKYRGLPEVNLTNYDFYDLATGTGYKNFYGMDTITGASTTVYLLTSQTPFAAAGFTSFYQAVSDLDFDLSLNVPLQIEGDCQFSVPITSSSNMTAKTFTIKFYRVDSGGTETQIGTTVTINKALSNESAVLSGKYVIPVTRLKAGEKLRFNISAPSPGATFYLYYLHDPKSRSLGIPATTNSQLIINLPIKL